MPYERAWKMITAARRVLMTTHARPDGDGLGALAALGEFLAAAGKELRVVLPTPAAAKYGFLCGSRRFEVLGRDVAAADLPRDYDLLLVIDTCAWEQLDGLQELIQSYRDRVLVIDHHATRDDLRHQELVDAEAAATGQIVLRLLEGQGAAITPGMAEALFVSLVSDTGWLRFANATAEAYATAGRLVELGAQPAVLYERLFQSEPVAKVRLTGEAMATLTVSAEGDVSHFWLTREMFARCGADMSDTENIVDECQRVAGVTVGILFVEADGPAIRVSLRSKRDVDMAAIAKRFGGGGHARAAGCRVRGSLDEVKRTILEAVSEAMGRPASPCR